MSVPPPLPVHNPYAAPAARVDEAPVDELVLADRGLRLAAAIIDGLIWAAIFVGAAIALPAVLPTDGGDPNPVALAGVGLVLLAAFGVVLTINLMWLQRYGQTIAKRWLSIKVVRSDGSHCAVSRIVFARWLPVTLMGMIPLLGYVAQLVDALMIFRDDRRCLHDLIADTIVVRA